jgi:hypothetical protein
LLPPGIKSGSPLLKAKPCLTVERVGAFVFTATTAVSTAAMPRMLAAARRGREKRVSEYRFLFISHILPQR